MLNIKNIEKKIIHNGYCVIEKFLTKKQCEFYINILEKILQDRIKKKHFVGQRNSIVLYNFFIEDRKLYNLIYNKKIDKILKCLIDDDYVLTTATARNQYKSENKKIILKNSDTSGQKWHTDNRYLNGKALSPSLSYIVIFALEDFTKKNGSTMFLKKSHKIKKKIDTNFNKKIGYLSAKQGSLIFMDTNLLHKAGQPSNKSRWSIFNIYSPWFVKPYFQFNKFLKKKKLSKTIKKILHFNSVPPLNYTKGIRTLIK